MAGTAKETAADRAKHPKANRGSFGVGRDPLERLGGTPAKVVPPRVEVAGSGLLADYRFVWENDKAHDDTPKRKTLRKLLVDDPRGFVKDLKELEKAELAGQAGGGVPKGAGEGESADRPPPADLGTEKCLELIDDLLGDSG